MNTFRAAYAVIVAARSLYPETATVDVHDYGSDTCLDVFKAGTVEARGVPDHIIRTVRADMSTAAAAYAALAFGPRSAWPKYFTIAHTGTLGVADADRTAGDHVFNGRVWTGIGEQAIQVAHDVLSYHREKMRCETLRRIFAFQSQYDRAFRRLTLATGAPEGYRHLFPLARSIVKRNPVSPVAAWVAAGAATR